MEFGIFTNMYHPKHWRDGKVRTEHETLKNELEYIQIADRNGFKYSWSAEHHFLDEYSHLSDNETFMAYALAVIHLVVILATQFPGSARRPLPYSAHGIIELVVGLALVVVPLVRHWTYDAGKFYPAMGVVILIIWAITRYRDPVVPVAAPPVA